MGNLMNAAAGQQAAGSKDVKMEDVSRKRTREEAIQEFDRACKKVNVVARAAREHRVEETKSREQLYGIPRAGIRNKDVNLKHKFQFLTVVIRDGMRVTAGEDTDDFAVVVKARPQHFAKRMMMAWNLCNPDAKEGTNFFFRGRLLSEYHMLMDVPGFCDEEAVTVLWFPKGKRPPHAQEEVNPPLRLIIRDVFRRSSVDYIVRKNDRLEKVSNHWMEKHCKHDQGARIYDFESASGNKRMAPTMKFEEVGLTTSNSVILTMAAGGQAQSQEMKQNRLLNERDLKNLRQKIETGGIPPKVLQGPAAATRSTHQWHPKAVFVHPPTPHDCMRVKEEPESDNYIRVKREPSYENSGGHGNSAGSTRREEDVNAMENVRATTTSATTQCSGKHSLGKPRLPATPPNDGNAPSGMSACSKETFMACSSETSMRDPLVKEGNFDAGIEYEYFMQEWLLQQVEEEPLTPPAPHTMRICGDRAAVKVEVREDNDDMRICRDPAASREKGRLAVGKDKNDTEVAQEKLRGQEQEQQQEVPLIAPDTKEGRKRESTIYNVPNIAAPRRLLVPNGGPMAAASLLRMSEPSSSHDMRICGVPAASREKGRLAVGGEGKNDTQERGQQENPQQEQEHVVPASPASEPTGRGKRRPSMASSPGIEAIKISIRQDNPKIRGSQSAARYEAYKVSRTVKEFYELGGRTADYKYDLSRGFITLLEQ